MLAKRIIPCLDIDRGRVVKGVNFVNLLTPATRSNRPAFTTQPAPTRLVFLDITATHEGRDTVAEVVRRVADQVFLPLTVAAGSSVEDMRRSCWRSG
jgi:cyclase